MRATVKGFVLAAGLGQRLSPITDSVPKPLLPVGNLPLIGYALRLLAYHGINQVIVNVHHLGKLVKESLGDGRDFGVHITYSEEEEILGTGGGLKRMHEQLADDTFVVVNGDTILDLDLGSVIETHKKAGALATMVLREDPRQQEYGNIEVDAEGRVRRVLGHGAEGQSGLQPRMFAGVHVMEARFLEYLPPDVNTCVVRYGYTKALGNNELVLGVTTAGYWIDAGTPERYLQANLEALSQTLRVRHADPLAGFALAPKRAVAEVVRMGKDVDLGEGATVLPPVLLGDEAKVGERATVGPYAVIGSHAHIGREAKVWESVVLEGAKIDAQTRAHRAIIGRKAELQV